MLCLVRVGSPLVSLGPTGEASDLQIRAGGVNGAEELSRPRCVCRRLAAVRVRRRDDAACGVTTASAAASKSGPNDPAGAASPSQALALGFAESTPDSVVDAGVDRALQGKEAGRCSRGRPAVPVPVASRAARCCRSERTVRGRGRCRRLGSAGHCVLPSWHLLLMSRAAAGTSRRPCDTAGGCGQERGVPGGSEPSAGTAKIVTVV